MKSSLWGSKDQREYSWLIYIFVGFCLRADSLSLAKVTSIAQILIVALIKKMEYTKDCAHDDRPAKTSILKDLKALT